MMINAGDGQKSEKNRLLSLSILANLSLREGLRQKILAQNGLEFFITIVQRRENLFESVEAQRYAAKGLVNLASTKRELRLRCITELGE